MAKSMSNVVKYPVVAKERSNEIRLLDQFGDGRNMSSEKLIEIHNSDLLKKYPKLKSNPDSLSNGEFVLLVMYAMNKIDEKDVLLLSKVFESLDVNGYVNRIYYYVSPIASFLPLIFITIVNITIETDA